MESPKEAFGHAFLKEAGRQIFFERRLRTVAKSRVVEVGARGAHDPEVRRKQSIGIQTVKRRQQHAPGEIARRSEQQ